VREPDWEATVRRLASHLKRKTRPIAVAFFLISE
jgi:hypothetical protein